MSSRGCVNRQLTLIDVGVTPLAEVIRAPPTNGDRRPAAEPSAVGRSGNGMAVIISISVIIKRDEQTQSAKWYEA